MEHVHADDPKQLFMILLALLLGAIAKVFGDIHNLVANTLFLHYIFMCAQGVCYIGSAGVAFIAIYKFFKGKK